MIAMNRPADRFAACADAVMTARGAFTPSDPLLDGPAAHGVGLGLLSVWIGGPADVPMLRALAPDAAARILHRMVWLPCGAPHFAEGVDLALFAFALEAGTMRALAELQDHLGLPASGAPDAETIAAAAELDADLLARDIAALHEAWRMRRGLPCWALPHAAARPPVRADA
jgi:lysozyme family protein